MSRADSGPIMAEELQREYLDADQRWIEARIRLWRGIALAGLAAFLLAAGALGYALGKAGVLG